MPLSNQPATNTNAWLEFMAQEVSNVLFAHWMPAGLGESIRGDVLPGDQERSGLNLQLPPESPFTRILERALTHLCLQPSFTTVVLRWSEAWLDHVEIAAHRLPPCPLRPRTIQDFQAVRKHDAWIRDTTEAPLFATVIQRFRQEAVDVLRELATRRDEFPHPARLDGLARLIEGWRRTNEPILTALLTRLDRLSVASQAVGHSKPPRQSRPRGAQACLLRSRSLARIKTWESDWARCQGNWSRGTRYLCDVDADPEGLYSLWVEFRLREALKQSGDPGVALLARAPTPEPVDGLELEFYDSYDVVQKIEFARRGEIQADPRLIFRSGKGRVWVQCQFGPLNPERWMDFLPKCSMQAGNFDCRTLLVVTPFSPESFASGRSSKIVWLDRSMAIHLVQLPPSAEAENPNLDQLARLVSLANADLADHTATLV